MEWQISRAFVCAPIRGSSTSKGEDDLPEIVFGADRWEIARNRCRDRRRTGRRGEQGQETGSDRGAERGWRGVVRGVVREERERGA